MKPYIVTLTGPSCAGKSHLENLLVTTCGFERAISTTTRTRRAGESEDSYHFVTRERFIAMLEDGLMIEYVEFNGDLYGLSRDEALRISSMDRPMVAVVEPQGRRQISDYAHAAGWHHHAVYVGNPDEVIAERYLARLADELAAGTESVDTITARYARRLSTMMTVERAWVVEAFYQIDLGCSTKVYDRILTRYDETNSNYVAASIENEFRHCVQGDALSALAA